MKNKKATLGFLLAVGLLLVLCLPVIGAYGAHNNDADNTAFLAAYPDAEGTKLDNCYLCHSGSPEGSKKTLDSCDYCHSVYGLKPPHGRHYPDIECFWSGLRCCRGRTRTLLH